MQQFNGKFHPIHGNGKICHLLFGQVVLVYVCMQGVVLWHTISAYSEATGPLRYLLHVVWISASSPNALQADL